jgi:hypothetical protein
MTDDVVFHEDRFLLRPQGRIQIRQIIVKEQQPEVSTTKVVVQTMDGRDRAAKSGPAGRTET